MLEPMNDRVLVRPAPKEEKIGSIFIPDQSKKLVNRGTVHKVGPGKYYADLDKRLPINVEVGDEVIFIETSGYQLNDEDGDFILLSSDEIVAKVVKSE